MFIGDDYFDVIARGSEPSRLRANLVRLAARYANACNLIASDVDEVAHRLGVLRAHCEADGRDYDANEKGDHYAEKENWAG